MEDIILTVLGCSDSYGTPRAGGDWGECDETEPKNTRTRSSLLISDGASTLIVDTGPDFRLQTVREGIKLIDGVFYTHEHSDHINGFDDLRVFFERAKNQIPVFSVSQTLVEIQRRFPHAFIQTSPTYPPTVTPRTIAVTNLAKPQFIAGIEVIPFLQKHGQGQSLGLRIGDVAYSTDMSNLDDVAIDVLKGVKVWIADCADFFFETAFVHCNWKRLQELNAKIGAEKVYLSHMKYNADYQKMNNSLPAGYRMSFDGLKIRADGTVLNDEG
jgi:phosphoribosyl 1,2-cyclic phosphate phosphodiesterase